MSLSNIYWELEETFYLLPNLIFPVLSLHLILLFLIEVSTHFHRYIFVH